MPSTGVRDISGLLSSGTTGSLRISRDGPFVTLTLDQITRTMSGLLASLPVGFRPRSIHRWPVENGQSISISVAGDLYPAAGLDIQNTFSMTYPTNDSWPTVLPGT